MTISVFRPTNLGASSKATEPFQPRRTSVPYREADQTYCNGGSPLEAFPAAKASPPQEVPPLGAADTKP
jgi:hypothetical protein